MRNDGIKNEYLFIEKLNNKRIRELNFLLQEFIYDIFDDVTCNSIIRCSKNVDYEKGDICIKIGSRIKYVSIKKGKRNSVHCESLNKFIDYLTSLGLKKKIISKILKYHYGDGTKNGTGKKRLSASEYKKKYYKSIKKVNKYLNKEKIVKSSINRFIIQGTQESSNKIDILVYGNPTDFLWIKTNEIYKYILSKCDLESSAIHFSCLTYQPMSRVLNFDKNKEYMRNWIQIKWYNLEDNIIEIMNERTKFI